MRTPSRIVFDSNDIVLSFLRPMEIHNAQSTLVSTANPSVHDPARVVPAAFTPQSHSQVTDGWPGVQVRVMRMHKVTQALRFQNQLNSVISLSQFTGIAGNPLPVYRFSTTSSVPLGGGGPPMNDCGSATAA